MVLYRKYRPERLQFHQHCLAATPAAAAVLPTTCAQEARLTTDVASNDSAALSGGFSSFAATYPQYCESKCSAAATGFGDSCCQLMVEPSYAANSGPTQLLSFLFVGSQTDSLDAEVMRQHGITHVLNVSTNCPQSQHVPAANFIRVPVNDGYADKLLPHFKRAFQFLDNVRRSNGRCLVHCLAGVSRSPTLTIAYIMQHKHMSQDEAYRHVKSRRPSISPNFNFLGQLLEFERQLQLQATATATTVADDDADDLGNALLDVDAACPEAKRQRRFLQCESSQSLSPPPLTTGQSPTSALSRLTFVQQQMQKLAQSSKSGSATKICDDTAATAVATPASALACHQRRRQQQQQQRQRPRSVALTGSAAAETTSAAAVAAASDEPAATLSASASASLSGSQEITCS